MSSSTEFERLDLNPKKLTTSNSKSDDKISSINGSVEIERKACPEIEVEMYSDEKLEADHAKHHNLKPNV